jgi:hypothetical protein
MKFSVSAWSKKVSFPLSSFPLTYLCIVVLAFAKTHLLKCQRQRRYFDSGKRIFNALIEANWRSVTMIRGSRIWCSSNNLRNARITQSKSCSASPEIKASPTCVVLCKDEVPMILRSGRPYLLVWYVQLSIRISLCAFASSIDFGSVKKSRCIRLSSPTSKSL